MTVGKGASFQASHAVTWFPVAAMASLLVEAGDASLLLPPGFPMV